MKSFKKIGTLDAMKKNTSISLGQHYNVFINNEIASGRYKNTSEVVQDGLRLLESQRNREADLRDAIEEGRNSGYSKDYNMKSFLEELERKNGVGNKF